MKEYYIWESQCPNYYFSDVMQREQIIVVASHIDDALKIMKRNNVPSPDCNLSPYLFAGTLPITDESINYLDFVHYVRPIIEDKTDKAFFEEYHCYPERAYQPQCPIDAYNQPHVVIRRVTNCPLVA